MKRYLIIDLQHQNGHPKMHWIYVTANINVENYWELLFEAFFNDLHDDKLRHGLFQQDIATVRTTRATYNI